MLRDPVTLARVQFGLTIMFHYLFPPLSIGLGLLLVCFEGLYLKTKDRDYETLARFFTKLFAVNFAVGVATGIVMEFEFGTNWAPYSRFVGDVFGSALAAEGIFAFFLESGFLGVLVFGWERVGPRTHMLATTMVFLGSVFSAVWIVIANSWQQTPAGYHLMKHGRVERAEIVDFWAMVFNPSSMQRLLHVLLGAFVLGAFFVLSVCAYYLLRQRHERVARKAFTVALVVAALGSLAIAISGDSQARAVAVNQPPKLAAFEGHFHTGTEGAPMWLFGIPDARQERVRYGIAIPKLLSFLVHRDLNRPVTGLDRTPAADRPPVVVPFITYHLMIIAGVYALALTLLALGLLWRRKLFEQRWLLKLFVVSLVAPYVANEAGWVAAEVGRQPWVVYGLLRTRDAVSPNVPAIHVVGSIALFVLLYGALFSLWVFVLNDKIQHGPEDYVPSPTTPAR